MNFYDLAYAVGGLLAAVVWIFKPSAWRKIFHTARCAFGTIPRLDATKPAVLIHAVSVGEVNATGELVRRLRQARPELHVIVTASTDTGFQQAAKLYSKQEGVTVFRFPLDFSLAMRRMLKNLRPSVAVLMELELWPNFSRQCRKLDIPIIVVNGRLTPTSYQRYFAVRWLVKGMFQNLQKVCAQEDSYARRFIVLGTPRERVHVTGTMKFDTAQIAPTVSGAAELAKSVGLSPGSEPVWVCGSTGPGEEKIVLEQYRQLLARFPNLRLVIVPRRQDRFDEAATLIQSFGMACVRLTAANGQGQDHAVVLGDTFGDLRKLYSIADVVFVGRTLVDLGSRQHGSDMIEPAALGKPVIVGPFTGNFFEPMELFRNAEAMIVVRDGNDLRRQVENLLSDPAYGAVLGAKAQKIVQANQGATEKHVAAILEALSTARNRSFC